MVFVLRVDKTVVVLCVCILCSSLRTDSRPVSRRSVSEVFLMHSKGMHKHQQQRQDWLQDRMQDIHTAPLHDGKISDGCITLKHSPSQAVTPDTSKGDVVESLEIQ